MVQLQVSVDEYIPMAKSTHIEAMIRISILMVKVFGVEYLREPNVMDATKRTKC